MWTRYHLWQLLQIISPLEDKGIREVSKCEVSDYNICLCKAWKIYLLRPESNPGPLNWVKWHSSSSTKNKNSPRHSVLWGQLSVGCRQPCSGFWLASRGPRWLGRSTGSCTPPTSTQSTAAFYWNETSFNFIQDKSIILSFQDLLTWKIGPVIDSGKAKCLHFI